MVRSKILLLALALCGGVLLPAPITNAITISGVSGYATAPTSIEANAVEGGAYITWNLPLDVGSGITGYIVEKSTNGTSWSQITTLTSSQMSYTALGLSAVSHYFRVAATTSSGTGIYGYPWTKLYGTFDRNRGSNGQIIYESNYGVAAGDPYNTMQSKPFTRIRYRLDTTLRSNGITNFADVDFYKWAYPGNSSITHPSTADASVRNLSIPTASTYTHIVHANVTDMNVYSNYSTVTSGRALSGRLEIWGIDYGWGPSGLSPAGNSGNYDYDDLPSAGSYGSFQVHDLTNFKTVFAWNHHGYGEIADLNYGTNTTSNAMPDSTFCYMGGTYGTCPDFSQFRLQIYANIPITPLADITAPTVSRVDVKSFAKNGDSITVRSTEVGTVYLVKSSIAVTNLASITGAPLNQRNSVSISSAGTNTALTTSGLQDGFYNLYAVDSMNNVSAALANTITMDSTAPTISNIAVNSTGSTITLTASETMTKTGVGENLYTISDGGPALTVGSTGGSANQLQVSVNRTIPAGAVVNFAYNPSNGVSGRWTDLAGNQLAAISSQTIANNSAATLSLALTVPNTIYKGVTVNISTVVDYVGKVTFLNRGKRIAGCISKRASGTPPITVNCAFKATTRGSTQLSALFTPTNPAIATSLSPIINRFILNKSSLR